MTGVLLLDARRCAGSAVLALICAAGCTSSGGRGNVDPFLARSGAAGPSYFPNGGPPANSVLVSASPQRAPAASPSSGVMRAAYEAATKPPEPIVDCDDPFAGQSELAQG